MFRDWPFKAGSLLGHLSLATIICNMCTEEAGFLVRVAESSFKATYPENSMT